MLKIEKDLESVTNPSVKKIAEQLILNASKDSLLSVTLDKENKSLVDMWKYVLQEAKKIAVEGATTVEDNAVFGWAQHYYDEDSIIMTKPLDTKVESRKEDEVDLPEEELDDFDF